MRLVIDTNVLCSALYDLDSTPGKILTLAAEGEVELVAPITVRVELERALRGRLGYAAEACEAALSALPVEWVEEGVYADAMVRATDAIADPTDAPLVALAMVLGCGVVSGDRDFHPLRRKVVKTWLPKDAAVKRRPRKATKRQRRRK